MSTAIADVSANAGELSGTDDVGVAVSSVTSCGSRNEGSRRAVAAAATDILTASEHGSLAGKSCCSFSSTESSGAVDGGVWEAADSRTRPSVSKVSEHYTKARDHHWKLTFVVACQSLTGFEARRRVVKSELLLELELVCD